MVRYVRAKRHAPTRRAAAAFQAFTTEVKEGKIDEYLKYHDEIWPDVAAGLRAAGVTCVIAASRVAASAQRSVHFPGS